MLLDISSLHVALPTSRGMLEAVSGVDLRMGRGETLGLIGESGCGKSMTALAVMGLLPEGATVSGSMVFDGIDIANADETAMRRLRGNRIGMIFQEPMTALNPLHTVGAQVAEPLRLHRGLSRADARAQALKLLERVRLPNAQRRLDAYPHELSGGQRQRVMIAAALACAPDLLIADEPTTALDATLRREILDLLAELIAERGMALMLISHDLAMMARRVQQVAVMYAGRVVDRGATSDVFTRLAHPYTRGLFGARPKLGEGRRARLATIPGRVPELGALGGGCTFADRCTFVMAACRTQEPALLDVTPVHAARCIRIADVLASDAV